MTGARWLRSASIAAAVMVLTMANRSQDRASQAGSGSPPVSGGQSQSGRATPEAGPPSRDVELTIRPSKAEYIQLEPVEVVVEYKNISRSPVLTRGDSNVYRRCEFRVRQDDEDVPLTRYGEVVTAERDDAGRAINPLLPIYRPSEGGAAWPVKNRVVLNLAFDMSRPGDYTLRVVLPLLDEDAATVAEARSKPVTIKVLPYSAVGLLKQESGTAPQE